MTALGEGRWGQGRRPCGWTDERCGNTTSGALSVNETERPPGNGYSAALEQGDRGGGTGLSFVINTYIWWEEPRCLDDNTGVEKEGKVRNVNTTELKLRQAAIQLLRKALNQIRIHRGKGS